MIEISVKNELLLLRVHSNDGTPVCRRILRSRPPHTTRSPYKAVSPDKAVIPDCRYAVVAHERARHAHLAMIKKLLIRL